GWWLYDDAYRRGSPLLELPAWEAVLRGRGFARVDAYPRDARAQARSDHGLLLALRPEEARAAPDAVPASPRGPLAGAALAPQPRPTLRTPYVAPRSDAERRVAAICAELLGVESVGVHDDFFELGADSLVTL